MGDYAQHVAITLFDELKRTDGKRHGWPLSLPTDDPKAPKGGIAVAPPTLVTYDPGNDRKDGHIVVFGKMPVVPVCCGVQIKVKCGMMLEGCRPGAYRALLPRHMESRGSVARRMLRGPRVARRSPSSTKNQEPRTKNIL